jgi:hypothetical protein
MKIWQKVFHLYSVVDGCTGVLYLFTAVGLTRSGTSTLHTYTNNTQNNTMKQNTQNITYITIRVNKHNNKKHNSHK